MASNLTTTLTNLSPSLPLCLLIPTIHRVSYSLCGSVRMLAVRDSFFIVLLFLSLLFHGFAFFVGAFHSFLLSSSNCLLSCIPISPFRVLSLLFSTGNSCNLTLDNQPTIVISPGFLTANMDYYFNVTATNPQTGNKGHATTLVHVVSYLTPSFDLRVIFFFLLCLCFY